MTKKFTEKQYQDIIEEWEGEISETNATKAIIDYLKYEDLGYMSDEAMAIANPLTREWAYDKFVEKEKKYYWKRNGLYLKKDEFDGSIIFDSYKNLFTESEIIFCKKTITGLVFWKKEATITITVSGAD